MDYMALYPKKRQNILVHPIVCAHVLFSRGRGNTRTYMRICIHISFSQMLVSICTAPQSNHFLHLNINPAMA